VISENNLADSFETLSTKISVSSLKNTEIISISVVDKNAYRSYELANWVADVFKEEISQIYNDTSVNILDHAVEPKSPYNVDVVKQEIIYMVAGMVLGGGVFLLRGRGRGGRPAPPILAILAPTRPRRRPEHGLDIPPTRRIARELELATPTRAGARSLDLPDSGTGL